MKNKVFYFGMFVCGLMADIFLRDARVEPLGATSGGTHSFFCTDGDALKWTCLKPNATTSALEQKSGGNYFSEVIIYLRPVIDITY